MVGNWAGQQVHQNLNSNDPNALLVAAAGLDGQSFNSVGALASNLAGGFAGALVGGSSGNTQGNFFNGGAAGQNAFENNYLNHVQLSQRDKELAACTSDQCRQDTRARWNAVSEEQQSSTRENIASSGTAGRERVQGQLASDMQGLVDRRSELQAELDSATNAQQRAQLSQQISETDNHIRQVANLGKDNLELLYQATGNLDYRRASANLNAATNGNELADALMAGAAIMGGSKGRATATGAGTMPAGEGANGAAVATDGLAFRSDLPGHMIGPDGFTKSGQLSGTHNLNNATSALDTVGASYTLKPTGTAGVYELPYTYTNPATGKVVSGSKTVYDPVVRSDQTMIYNAQQAGKQAWVQFLKNPNAKIIDTSVGGINFRAYINVDKNGAAFIGNVHPIK